MHHSAPAQGPFTHAPCLPRYPLEIKTHPTMLDAGLVVTGSVARLQGADGWPDAGLRLTLGPVEGKTS